MQNECQPSSEHSASYNLFAGGGSYIQFVKKKKKQYLWSTIKCNKIRYAFIKIHDSTFDQAWRILNSFKKSECGY